MKYTDSHEWIREDGVVGITKYAQEELGEIVFVQLPTVGQRIEKGEEVAVLESTKAAADIYTPVSGEIIAVNEKVKEDPTLLNSSPEGEGWLFKIALANASELDTLLSNQQYQRMTHEA